MSAPVSPSRNPTAPRGPRITSHEIVRMRKLVQNGMTSRMMNRPLRLPARDAMKYARGNATSRHSAVPDSARNRLVTNGCGRSKTIE